MTSPIDRAMAVLAEEAERCRNSGTARLPGLYAMARSAGVSHQTMRKAVARLERAQTIEVVPKRGIFLPMPANRRRGGNGSTAHLSW